MASLLFQQAVVAPSSFVTQRFHHGFCPCRAPALALRKKTISTIGLNAVRASEESEANPKEDLTKQSIKESCNGGIQRMTSVAVALLAAGTLLMMPAGDALAAKSGGRVGGSAFRSSPPPSRSAPRPPPQVNRSRTSVYISPPVIAPPIFGYAPTPFFGGFSPFSPSYGGYSYGPTVAVTGGGGGLFSFLFFFVIAGVVFNVIRSLFRGPRDDDYD